jgi:hypothetical protein
MKMRMKTETDRRIRRIIARLDADWKRMLSRDFTAEELRRDAEFQERHGVRGGEFFFCPESNYYGKVLKLLGPRDVVWDVGAGDLRFDLMMSRRVRKVYAVELNPVILGRALAIIGYDMPENLVAVCGNAFDMPLPPDVTVVVCLMIHRMHPFPDGWRRQGVRFIWTEFGVGHPLLSGGRYEG